MTKLETISQTAIGVGVILTVAVNLYIVYSLSQVVTLGLFLEIVGGLVLLGFGGYFIGKFLAEWLD